MISKRYHHSVPSVNAAPAGTAVYNGGVTGDSSAVLALRLRTALALSAFGESIRRAQLRREHPDASEHEIDTMLTAWLQTRPGAEHGDAAGRPVAWPRR